MKTVIKKFIGKTLISIGNALPGSKPLIKSLGMRTSEEFFNNRRSANVQTPTGETLKLTNVSSNYLSFQLFWKGTIYYEPITTMVFQDLLHPDATFIDVGANIGFFSLIAALTRPGIKIIAFEPNPKNFNILRDNILANGFKNIQCEPLAISDVAGKATLHLNASDMSASLLPEFQNDFNPASKSIEIETATLDDFFDKHVVRGRLVLKIDVEGHEGAVLRGARRMLAADGLDVIMEVLYPYPDEIVSLFKHLGYRFYKITDEGLVRSESLVPVRRGDLCFLNSLISKRPEAEISQISERIVARGKHIDLKQTSKYFGPQTKPS